MNEVEVFNDDSYVIRSLLSPDHCQELIDMSEEIGYIDAPITGMHGPVMRPDMRNNERVILDSQDLAKSMFDMVREFVPIRSSGRSPIGLNERFRFYRYDIGQQFNWHYDGAFERANKERSLTTLIFYLNDGYEGGETEFLDFSVKGGIGDAFFFRHKQRHRGAPVTKGRKYVLRTDVMYSAPIAS